VRFHPLLIAPTAQNRAVTFRRTLLSGLSAAAINGERMSSLGILPPTEGTVKRGNSLPASRKNPRDWKARRRFPTGKIVLIVHDDPAEGSARWPASTSGEESKILPRSLAVRQCRSIASARRTGVRVYLHYVHLPVQDLSEKAQLGISRLLDLGDPIARVLDDL